MNEKNGALPSILVEEIDIRFPEIRKTIKVTAKTEKKVFELYIKVKKENEKTKA